ncbi:prolipoprotein diacylglyceryl transferase [Patescibacteria group bacterium]|nr:prolipoprotein diacylglyceryl transferase [Patescibacteria group bacterium]MBU1934696.1 prolipoprotein diacylglyceryl transferase [Patescibacteria group bacterium]
MLDPIAFSIGPLSIHWYGISYGVGLILGIWILTLLNKKRLTFKDNNQIFDFAFWIFLIGVIVGGRLGYVLFYNLPYFIQNPAKIFAVWDGGMSFHGGLILSIIVAYLFCRRQKISFLSVADIAVIPGALALVFTRLANFVNRELVGRVIESPKWEWLGVDFGDGLLRFPSQLFQSFNALLLFLILLLIFRRKPKKGVLLFSYLALYGLLRFVAEFWRAPDSQIGFIWTYFTLGQILSFLMLVAGVVGLAAMRR